MTTNGKPTLIACAAVLLTALTAMAEEAGVPRRDSQWALEVSQEEFDRESGEIRVQVRNTHQHQSVTAFGVVAACDRGDGRGSNKVMARDLLPGEGLAPGGVEEVTIKARRSDAGASAKYEACKIALHHEILSDATSHGTDSDYIDDVFVNRAIRFQESEKALARLRAARQEALGVLSKRDFWAGFWREEAQRGEVASNFVGVTTYGKPQTEDLRQRAVHSDADLSRQMKRRIDDGASVEETLDLLEHILDVKVKTYAAAVRPQDLERLSAEENGGAL